MHHKKNNLYLKCGCGCIFNFTRKIRILIIVFGALNVDMIMPLSHFPSVGETLKSEHYITRSGGKGSNQAMAAVRAGAKTAIVGKVGDDAFGRRSINNLKSQSVLTTGIGISDKPTGCASIWIDSSGKNMVVVSSGANLDATEDQIPDEILLENNTVLVQMEVPCEETFMLLRRAAEQGTRTIMNASPVTVPIPDDILQLLDYLIINDLEAKQLAKLHKFKTNTLEKIAKEFAKRGQLTCIITLGDKGVLALSPREEYMIAPLDVEVVDSTGAGDCFCGVFAAALEKGYNFTSALKRAVVAAGLSCEGLGAQANMPFEEEIEENLNHISDPTKI